MTVRPRRLVPWLLAACALAASCKKNEPTYGEKMVGAMREGKALDARGDMETISIALTQWLANDGNLADAKDFPTLVGYLQPTWVRVAPTLDPFGNSYVFTTDGQSAWELRCLGKDGAPNTADDVVMQNGQITQLPKSNNPMVTPP